MWPSTRRWEKLIVSRVFCAMLLLFLAGVPCGKSQTPIPAPHPAPLQWEYRVVTKDQVLESGKKNLTAGLDRLGEEGWELVGIESTSPPVVFYFKRPRTSAAERIEELKNLVARFELDAAVARERADWAERMARKGYAYESNVSVTQQQLKIAELALERARKQLKALTDGQAKPPDKEDKRAK